MFRQASQVYLENSNYTLTNSANLLLLSPSSLIEHFELTTLELDFMIFFCFEAGQVEVGEKILGLINQLRKKLRKWAEVVGC